MLPEKGHLAKLGGLGPPCPPGSYAPDFSISLVMIFLPYQKNLRPFLSIYLCAFSSIIGYQLVYPQFLSGTEQTETSISVATRKVVDILESTEKKHFGLGSKFLCGDKLTVADLYVATIILQLEWVESVDMKLWPKLNRWLKDVRKQEHWETVHVKHKEFVEALKNVPLEST